MKTGSKPGVRCWNKLETFKNQWQADDSQKNAENFAKNMK